MLEYFTMYMNIWAFDRQAKRGGKGGKKIKGYTYIEIHSHDKEKGNQSEGRNKNGSGNA